MVQSLMQCFFLEELALWYTNVFVLMSYPTKSQHLIQLKAYLSKVSDPLSLTVLTFLMALKIIFQLFFFSATAFIITPIYKHFHEYFYYLSMFTSGVQATWLLYFRSTSVSLPNNNHPRHSSKWFSHACILQDQSAVQDNLRYCFTMMLICVWITSVQPDIVSESKICMHITHKKFQIIQNTSLIYHASGFIFRTTLTTENNISSFSICI